MYLVLVMAAEHIAGSTGFIPNQTAKVARLLAVVDEFGYATWPLLKEDGVPQRVPWIPYTSHTQHTPHPGTRDPQNHWTVVHLKAQEIRWLSDLYEASLTY